MLRRLAILTTAAALIPATAVLPAQAALGPWSAPIRLYAAGDIQTSGFSYAPSAVAGSPLRLYSCHSRSSGTIRDNIFLTKKSGSTTISSTSVLNGSGTGWDNFHNCDPSVVRVDVPYQGHRYSYAMFYLGNDVDASDRNAVGVAVADNSDGPWTKLPGPLIPYPGDWGAGQPTATTIDPAAGTVVLAWTEGHPGNTFGWAAQVSFGSGQPVVSHKRRIPEAGLTTIQGGPDWLNNFDLAYSTTRDRFYLVREGHPYPEHERPGFISTELQIASIGGTDFWNGTGSWTVEGRIAPALSGKPRNHNPGLLRTIYGTLPDERSLTVVYTTAELDQPDQWTSLWTYTLWQTTAAIN